MNDDTRCERCEANALPSRRFCATCATEVDTWEARQRAVRAQYTVRADDPERIPMSLAQAAARVSEFVGQPVRPGNTRAEGQFDAAEAVEAATWWFIPFCSIGSSGYMVEKRDGAVHALGSNLTSDDYFWAQAAGILGEPFDLVVDAVHDREKTTELLARALRYPTSEHLPATAFDVERMASALEALPARFERQWFWFHVKDLRRATEAGILTCHGEPPSAAAVPPGTIHVVLDVGAIRALGDDAAHRRLLADAVLARLVEVDATYGLRGLAVHGDVVHIPPVSDRESAAWHARAEARRIMGRRARAREDVPCRLVGRSDYGEPDTEAEEIAKTLASGAALELVTHGDESPAVPFGVTVIPLATFLERVRTLAAARPST